MPQSRQQETRAAYTPITCIVCYRYTKLLGKAVGFQLFHAYTHVQIAFQITNYFIYGSVVG
jgi:hypothetical protein